MYIVTVCLSVCLSVSLYMEGYIHIYIHMYTHIYIYVHIYTYMQTCMCMCVYIYIYNAFLFSKASARHEKLLRALFAWAQSVLSNTGWRRVVQCGPGTVSVSVRLSAPLLK